MVSYSDLALQQSQNPSNPYLQDLTPAQQALIGEKDQAWDPSGSTDSNIGGVGTANPQTGVTYGPTSQGGGVYPTAGWANPNPTVPPVAKSNTYQPPISFDVPTKADVAAANDKYDPPLAKTAAAPAGPGSSGTKDAEGKVYGATNQTQVPGATPAKPASGGGGATLSKPSPEEELKTDLLRHDRDVAGSYDRDAQTMDWNQHFLQAGQLATKTALDSANFQYGMAGNDIQELQRNTDYEAKQREAKIDREAEETRAMHVDPQKWFKDRGVAGTILAAISIGAGAMGAAMPHTNNPHNIAADIIDKSIERDVNAQQSNISNAWKKLDFDKDRSDHQFVQDQFRLNKMNEIRQTDFSHGIALVDQQKQMTTDQVAINNLDLLKEELVRKKAEGTLETAKAMYLVASRQKAAQAASANQTYERNQKMVEALAKKTEHYKDTGMDPAAARQHALDDFGLKTDPGALPAVPVKGQGTVSVSPDLQKKVTGSSTNWEPQRYLQGTEAFENKKVQERWNSNVLAAVHKRNPAARGLDAMQAIGAAYLITPGDSAATIKRKQDAFNTDFGGQPTTEEEVPDATPYTKE